MLCNECLNGYNEKHKFCDRCREPIFPTLPPPDRNGQAIIGPGPMRKVRPPLLPNKGAMPILPLPDIDGLAPVWKCKTDNYMVVVLASLIAATLFCAAMISIIIG